GQPRAPRAWGAVAGPFRSFLLRLLRSPHLTFPAALSGRKALDPLQEKSRAEFRHSHSLFQVRHFGGTTMLVLSRKPGEGLVIAGSIVVTVLQVEKGRVRLGIEAPPQVRVLRQELRSLLLGRTPGFPRTRAE